MTVADETRAMATRKQLRETFTFSVWQETSDLIRMRVMDRWLVWTRVTGEQFVLLREDPA